MKNKSLTISMGALILIFALFGLKNSIDDYISIERVEYSLQPVPVTILKMTKNFLESRQAENILDYKDIETGLILYRQGKFQESIDFYTEFLKHNPNNVIAYNRRGNVYWKLKQYDAAISDYNLAIRFNPIYWKPYNNRGNVYADLKQYDAAIADYTLSY